MYKCRILGTVLAAALAFGSAVPAFAASPASPESPANITIDSAESGIGSVYSAYRLLDLTTSLKVGDHDHDEGALPQSELLQLQLYCERYLP